MASLRAFRRVKGLCDRCAEKWHRGHTCGATVQLQAIQEVWELLPTEEDTTTPQPESALEEQLFSVVLSEVVTGNSKKGVLQLIGVIQQVEVSILIDSGSTHSFVSQFVLPKFASVVLQETSFLSRSLMAT
jgi:hypothetical protein